MSYLGSSFLTSCLKPLSCNCISNKLIIIFTSEITCDQMFKDPPQSSQTEISELCLKKQSSWISRLILTRSCFRKERTPQGQRQAVEESQRVIFSSSFLSESKWITLISLGVTIKILLLHSESFGPYQHLISSDKYMILNSL